MILAAGRGERMRPLTDTTPKPLIPVAGRSMLDRAMDRLQDHGTRNLVINVHHLGEQIAAHVGAGRAHIIREESLLETGGSVKNALPLLGQEPFYVLNGDGLWTDGAIPMLKRMEAAWDPARMDALLLLHPTKTAVGYEGKGDFFINAADVPRRRVDPEIAPLLFSGIQILHPRLFEGCPSGKFSLNVLYDRALAEGRLFGMVHDGGWFHVGTPDALPQVEALLGG